MAYEKSGQTPTMSVIRGSSTTVLEMEDNVVDFVTICSTPWNNGQLSRYLLLSHDQLQAALLIGRNAKCDVCHYRMINVSHRATLQCCMVTLQVNLTD